MLANHKKTIQKIAEESQPKVVVEVGLKYSTKDLLPIFTKLGAHYHGVDPVRCPDVPSKNFTYHEGLSLDVLPTIKNIDFVMLDGDHTYYTVFHELKLLHQLMKKGGVILFHDVEPPHNRKDLYYNIDLIPEEYRNGPKQGVLTAVEDFLDLYKEFYTPLETHSGFNGLGVIRRIK